MGLSSTITVTSDVEDIPLSELLNLLGSPKSLKEALSNLEKGTKDFSKALKALNKAQAEAIAQVQRDSADLDDLRSLAVQAEEKAQAAEAKLVASKNNKLTELKNAEAEALAEKTELLALQGSMREREEAIKRAEENMTKERQRMEKEYEAAKKEIAKDMKAAEKYRQQALQIRREADDKIEAMKKVVA